MRIDMVSEHASPLAVLGGADAGGQNVHVAALSTALAERGHQVRVYTRRDSWRLRPVEQLAPGVEVVHVPAGPAQPVPKDELLRFMPAFGRFMARHWQSTGRPDLVHSHFWMSGVAALEAQRSVAIPTVQTFHALGSVKQRHQGASDTSPPSRVGIETGLARDAYMVIATCRDEVLELSRMGVPTDHVRVVPCGVDTDHFTPGAAAAGAEGAAHEAAPRRTRLLSLGRMVERKGVGTAVEALVQLPDAELVIGGGPPHAELGADPEAARLRSLADRLGVLDRVHFVGQVGHAEVPRLIRSADIVLCTPWYEPFGIVPLEAMACGRPLVGSSVGGLLDSVLDGVTGVLVPARDPGAVARAVRDLVADPTRMQRIGRAARARAVELYDWRQVALATEVAYEELLSAPAITVSATVDAL